MKIKGMEHVDNFGILENTCWLAVDDVPECFIEEAKKIDGENYSEDCFGICVIQMDQNLQSKYSKRFQFHEGEKQKLSSSKYNARQQAILSLKHLKMTRLRKQQK